MKFFEKNFRRWGNGWAKIACSEIFGRGWATGGLAEQASIWARVTYFRGGGAESVRASLTSGLGSSDSGTKFAPQKAT